MSVLLPGDEREPFACELPAAPACFFCCEPLTFVTPSVLWCGYSGLVVLHPPCAESLGVHLVGDAREARLAGAEPHWTRRAVRALRAGVQVQEQRT